MPIATSSPTRWKANISIKSTMTSSACKVRLRLECFVYMCERNVQLHVVCCCCVSTRSSHGDVPESSNRRHPVAHHHRVRDKRLLLGTVGRWSLSFVLHISLVRWYPTFTSIKKQYVYRIKWKSTKSCTWKSTTPNAFVHFRPPIRRQTASVLPTLATNGSGINKHFYKLSYILFFTTSGVT